MTTDECMNVLTGLERQLAKEVGAGADKTIEVEFATHHGEPVVNSYKVSGPRSALPASISAAANLALFGEELEASEPVILSVKADAPTQSTATGAATVRPETAEIKESLILEPEAKSSVIEVKASAKGKKTAKTDTAKEQTVTAVETDKEFTRWLASEVLPSIRSSKIVDAALIDVHMQDGRAVTTSRNIAEVFDKDHKNVIRDIRAIIDANPDKNFTGLNFELSSYTDSTGRKLPEYQLTRDGTMLLIIGYTGAQAMALKTAYIKRFNEMEQATATGAAATNPETTEPKESLILKPEVKPVEAKTFTKSNKATKAPEQAVAILEPQTATTISTEPNVYVFDNAIVRTDRTSDGEPLFCAKDVCDILGYANARDAVRQHTDSNYDVVKCDIIDKLGRKQSMTFVNESGLYALIFGSKLESAKAFKRWVTSEVLPSIRKTGAYATHQTETKPKSITLETKVNVARIVLEAAGITGNQLALALDKGIRKDTGESSLEWTGTQLTAPTQERLLNPTELGKSLGLGPRAVNSRLQSKGYQIKGVAGWELTEKGKALGGVYLDTGKKHSSGAPVRQIKWPSGLSL